jgi:uncharacterized membrane protein required for colicin V production
MCAGAARTGHQSDAGPHDQRIGLWERVVDVLLVGFIGGFIFGGWRSGFLRRLIGIGFMAISFVVSAWFRYPVGAIASTFFKDIPPDYANLVGYTIAFPVVLGALHLGSRMLLGRVSVQGLTKEADQALGALFGGVEAILILSAGIAILDTYFGTSSTLSQQVGLGALKSLTEALNGSTTVHILRDTTVPFVLTVLGPLLPKDVKTILPGGLPGGLPGFLPGGLPFPTP